MDITAIAQVIGSVGFPIVACVYMATKFEKTLVSNTEVTKENSMILTKLFNRLDELEGLNNDPS